MLSGWQFAILPPSFCANNYLDRDGVKSRSMGTSASNAFGQQSALALEVPVATDSLSQKLAICLSFVMFLSGARPSISMKRHLLLDAKFSTRADLPMRLRPDTTAREEDAFRHSEERQSR